MPGQNGGYIAELDVGLDRPVRYVDLKAFLAGRSSPLPYCLRVVAENLLRSATADGERLALARQVAAWSPVSPPLNVPLTVSRVIFPDSSGLPALMDLASARQSLADRALPAEVVEPIVPVDLVIDHSLTVDFAGKAEAEARNTALEYRRNGERYAFFKWAEQAFERLRVAPPGMGIIHQIHLEYLAKVVALHPGVDGCPILAPEFVLGCDSHTPMVNSLGLLAWGVGGIDAEAAMLGQPYSVRIPRVVGVRLSNRLRAGTTSTDLVLTITQMLRKIGVVGDFVEFFGDGACALPVADRATIANMAPEYGATIGFFPIDGQTIDYLRKSGRSSLQVGIVEKYARAAGLYRDAGNLSADQRDPEYSAVVEIDLAEIVPSIAGPKRPQDRHGLAQAGPAFHASLVQPVTEGGYGLSPAQVGRAIDVTLVGDAELDDGAGDASGVQRVQLKHGSIVIAAITSCTNTSNPGVMIAAGLLAREAVRRGLSVAPGIKTSLAPGSRVVRDYLEGADLLRFLEALGFHVVGYGCTTCSGKSGPIAPEIASAVAASDLIAVSVLSGNRNFEGRIHKSTRASYLASPPLVVAYALAGRIDIDFATEPLGSDDMGQPVFLADIWPDASEIADLVRISQRPEQYTSSYADLFSGTKLWRELPAARGPLFDWDPKSTYIKRPPFFQQSGLVIPDVIANARALCVFGDSLTTDQIIPSGEILIDSVAGQYLIRQGVAPGDFNAVTQRRGNHEFMARVTFGNQRLKNLLAGGVEGPLTRCGRGGDLIPIYDAAVEYARSHTPVIVIGGKDYGMGSSRDWAAKGPKLLGVQAVLAQSFERIHRANLIGMGIVPLVFLAGETFETLGLSGFERLCFTGLAKGIGDNALVNVVATDPDNGATRQFGALVDISGSSERDLLLRGGIFSSVMADLVGQAAECDRNRAAEVDMA